MLRGYIEARRWSLRKLRKLLDMGLPMLGVIAILAAVLFLQEIRGQIAVVMIGIILIEAGVWKLAHQLLPEERRFYALRNEIDVFIDLSRRLNDVALTLKTDDSPMHRQVFEEIRDTMRQSVEQIAQVAGKTDHELGVEQSATVALDRH